MYAFNPDGTTQHIWSTGALIFGSPAIGTNGTIYAGSYKSNFYAFNPDGTTALVWKIGGRVGASATIAPDGTVYIGAEDNKFYSLADTDRGVWPKFRRDLRNTGRKTLVKGMVFRIASVVREKIDQYIPGKGLEWFARNRKKTRLSCHVVARGAPQVATWPAAG